MNVSSDNRDWDRVLGDLIEIETHDHTHFCPKGDFHSRLDRIFWSAPPWASRLFSLIKPVFPPAQRLHELHLSDHSPIGISISPRASLPPANRPIPSFVTTHPHYKTMVRYYEKLFKVSYNSVMSQSNNNPFLALVLYKSILRRAAHDTRKVLIKQTNTSLSQESILTTLSRAIFSQD